MTPEELEEAKHYATWYKDGYVHDLIHDLIDHIEQDTRIIELEAQIKTLKKIAEDERAAVLTADICDGCDSYGDMSISGRAALKGEPTRVDDFEEREERIAMARRQLAKEHPEIDWGK